MEQKINTGASAPSSSNICIDRKWKLGKAEQILIDNGIEKDEAPVVLQAIGYALHDRDLYSKELDNKQDIAAAMRDVLCLTRRYGTDNALASLVYMPNEEKVRPIFEAGGGTDGYYDVDTLASSGVAMITDICNQFINKNR